MLRLKVDDMTCGHCVQTVTEAVKTVDPAARVKVDLPSKLVEVEGAAEPTRISDAVREAGYTPVAVE